MMANGKKSDTRKCPCCVKWQRLGRKKRRKFLGMRKQKQ